MSNPTGSPYSSKRIRRFGARWTLVSWTGRRLVVTAAAFHVMNAVALFFVGRTRIAPTMIDRDGIIGSFAFDSYEYQREAIQLAQFLQSGRVIDWIVAARPMHLKAIAIPFAILGPVFGYGTLGAEPYNLVCYTAIVALVFAMGREVYSRKIGLLAGAVVAVYPSFMLHTMQLLKDPLVITASLAIVLCVMTCLTRNHCAKSAAVFVVLAMLMTLLIFLARADLVIVCFATALISLILLGIRQVLERRYLFWNMFLPLPILLAVFLLYGSHRTERMKQFPAEEIGAPKIVPNTALRVPSLIVRVGSAPKSPDTFASRLPRAADALARRIGRMRLKLDVGYPDAGSILDRDREFKSFTDLLKYLPRAMEIGLWAPFPNSWISARRRVGNAGALLAGAETLFIYLCQVVAVWAVMREPRRLALWFLLAIATLGVTALAVVVPNVGALYRLRYAFWIIVIVVAMTVMDKPLISLSDRLRGNSIWGPRVIQE